MEIDHRIITNANHLVAIKLVIFDQWEVDIIDKLPLDMNKYYTLENHSSLVGIDFKQRRIRHSDKFGK